MFTYCRKPRYFENKSFYKELYVLEIFFFQFILKFT